MNRALLSLLLSLTDVFLSPALSCSFFNLFPYDFLETKKVYEYPYWELPTVKPGEERDQAIMLIGGAITWGFAQRSCLYE